MDQLTPLYLLAHGDEDRAGPSSDILRSGEVDAAFDSSATPLAVCAGATAAINDNTNYVRLIKL